MDYKNNITISKSYENVGYFHPIDYGLFVAMLLISIAIGIYFGYFDGKEKTTDEYLLGGRNMKTIPIAISLISSQLSALSIITLPAESYAFGIQYMCMVIFIIIVMTFVINYVILPVFYENHIDNCYAYLELRFSKTVRNLMAFLFFITCMCSLPVVCYVPSLAFSQATGYNVHIVNGIVSTICVIYTMMGGVKAVVWTDVLQAFIMILSIGIVLIFAVINVGGFQNVWTRGIAGNRISGFDMTFDLQTRQTFWNLLMGPFCTWTGHVGLNQSCVQRIVSLPSLSHARRALILFCLGVILIIGSSCILGVIMYAAYYDCDPVTSGLVEKYDKMIPFYVNDIVGHLFGMPGLFISSVFSASLSTISAVLNSLAGLLYNDYICNIRGYKHTEQKGNLIMKIIIIIIGIFCVLSGFIVEKSESMYQTSYTIISFANGPVCGIFLLGMLFPRANHKSALWALCGSLTILGAIVLASNIYKSQTNFVYQPLEMSIDGCELNNLTSFRNESINNNETTKQQPSSILLISFMWYAFIGNALVWLIGVPLSYLVGPKVITVNSTLISPLARYFLPKNYIQTEIEMKMLQIKVTECIQNNEVKEEEEVLYVF